MSRQRPTLDVSGLPRVTFGSHSLNWWATLGFMVIEGMTMAVAIAAYFYLRKNEPVWPPAPAPPPQLLVPTIGLLLLLALIIPMAAADRAAHREDLTGIRLWLAVTVGLTVAAVGVRLLEFGALETRWDAHAYGSIVWTVLGLHTALLLIDLLETAVLLALFLKGPVERKHLADVSDAGFYQYFLSLSYIPIYAVLFLSPRLL